MSLPPRDSPAITLIAPVSTVTQAAGAAAAGARLVDVGDRDALIPAIRDQIRDLRICGYGAGADIVRDASLAVRTGAGLICPDVRAAMRAGLLGISAERVLVQTVPGGIAAATQAGWATMVDLDCGWAGAAAVAAVCAWLGVRVIRTRHVTEVRRSIEMSESILGRRPPAGTLRGLA